MKFQQKSPIKSGFFVGLTILVIIISTLSQSTEMVLSVQLLRGI